MDILLTDEHDIEFVNGAATVTTDMKSSVAQRLKIALSTFQGEWFLDAELGIDYFGSVFGKRRRKETVDLIIQTAILSDPDVLRLTSYSSTITNDRRFEVNFTVLTSDGTTAPVTVQLGV